MHKLFNFILIWLLKTFFKLPFVEDRIINDQAARRIVDMYGSTGFGGLSVKVRFWDGPLQEMEELIPKGGRILDLGCGEGLFTNYLALSSSKRIMVGVEMSADRVGLANKGIKNTKFIKGDVISVHFPVCDHIVMCHLMHHLLSFHDQEKLIDRCSKHLRKNSKLIIAEVNKSYNWKYLLGWLTDTIIVPILFEGRLYNGQIFHRSAIQWKNLLEKNNFKIDRMVKLDRGPFPDTLFLATKV